MKSLPAFLLLLGSALGAHAHGISDADRQAMIEGGNLEFIRLGAGHMISGYDHLLFLFGVLFYLSGFKDILKFVTVFTLGHSITLILATYVRVTADYYLVDAVIALSVCYKAFDNLDGFRRYLKMASPHLLGMVFLFGLIHGFGLSTRLQQLPLQEDGLLWRILSFNLGVELGQVAALAGLLALLALFRRTAFFSRIGITANVLLLGSGIALFAYQMTLFTVSEGHPHHEEILAAPEAVPDSIPYADSATAMDSSKTARTSGITTGHDHGSHDHAHKESHKPRRSPKVKHTHTHKDGSTHSH
jgi:hypothetical protein